MGRMTLPRAIRVMRDRALHLEDKLRRYTPTRTDTALVRTHIELRAIEKLLEVVSKDPTVDWHQVGSDPRPPRPP